MTEPQQAEAKGGFRALAIAGALWAAAFGLSVVLAVLEEPTGSSFVRGMNRVGTFFRWQFLAFALAIVVWTQTRGRSDLSPRIVWLGRLPIAIQCALGLVGVVVVILAIILK